MDVEVMVLNPMNWVDDASGTRSGPRYCYHTMATKFGWGGIGGQRKALLTHQIGSMKFRGERGAVKDGPSSDVMVEHNLNTAPGMT
jgi:hypothetical protein